MPRPEVTIDWEKVEDLMLSGCSGIEIAACIGVNKDTLYDRTAKEKGMSYSDYSVEKKAKGESILRAHQYAKALGLTKKGDNTLLIWLGKQRLDQKENREVNFEVPRDQLLAIEHENIALRQKIRELENGVKPEAGA